MLDQVSLLDRFEEHRPRLKAVAFRIVGSFPEAEDAVQEAWIRLSRADVAEVGNLGGWLTTVVARVCLDQLRGRRSRPELPYGDALPASVAAAGDLGPEDEALLADSVGLALLVVQKVLTPSERLAFVLHDMFRIPFDEIGAILSRSPDAAKMLASRARRRVRGADPGGDTPLGQQRAVVRAFLAAARGGSLDGLVRILHPGVELRVHRPDGVTEVRTDAGRIAGQAMMFRDLAPYARMALLDGRVGIFTVRDGQAVSALSFVVRGDLVTGIEITLDAEKLRRLGVILLPATGSPTR